MLEQIKEVCSKVVEDYYKHGKTDVSDVLTGDLIRVNTVEELDDHTLRLRGTCDHLRINFSVIITKNHGYFALSNNKEDFFYSFGFYSHSGFVESLSRLGNREVYQASQSQVVLAIGECLTRWREGARGTGFIYEVLKSHNLERLRFDYSESHGHEFWTVYVGKNKFELSLGTRVMCTYFEDGEEKICPTLVANEYDFNLNFG